MRPATRPPHVRGSERLQWLDPSGRGISDHCLAELPDLLRPSDLLVVNDAATLPASLSATVVETVAAIELRLLGPAAPPVDDRHWWAVVLGEGDWRSDTDDRPPPPELRTGATVTLDASHGHARVSATIVERSPISRRLVQLRFDRGGDELYAALYAAGRPIQYSHLERDLELWSVQTVFAGRPWAAEMPSAGRPLTWALLTALRSRGIEIARLTHAAGISATGDPAIDAALPLPERYEIPPATVDAIARAQARGGRVIAVGTTVVRALEGSAGAHGGRVHAGPGSTDLVLGGHSTLQVVDGLITGMHEPGQSHFELLAAFADRGLLLDATRRAAETGYHSHEFGDLALVLSA